MGVAHSLFEGVAPVRVLTLTSATGKWGGARLKVGTGTRHRRRETRNMERRLRGPGHPLVPLRASSSTFPSFLGTFRVRRGPVRCSHARRVQGLDAPENPLRRKRVWLERKVSTVNIKKGVDPKCLALVRTSRVPISETPTSCPDPAVGGRGPLGLTVDYSFRPTRAHTHPSSRPLARAACWLVREFWKRDHRRPAREDRSRRHPRSIVSA